MHSSIGNSDGQLATVILPVYRPNKIFLKEAISSICLQSLDKKYFCVFVCFDGPHDPEILEFTHKSFFNGITKTIVVTEKKLGLTCVLNYMMKRVTTPYFFRFDSDDIMHPDRLRIQLKALIKNNFDLCGSRIAFIDKRSELLPKVKLKYPRSDFLIRLVGSLYNNPFSHPSVSGKVSSLAFHGYYKQVSPFEDYHLWSCYSKNTKLQNLPESLLYYRIHSQQITKNRTVPYKKLISIRMNFFHHLIIKYPLAIFIAPFIVFLIVFPLGPIRSIVK